MRGVREHGLGAVALVLLAAAGPWLHAQTSGVKARTRWIIPR
jgi:hypothetical protein